MCRHCPGGREAPAAPDRTSPAARRPRSFRHLYPTRETFVCRCRRRIRRARRRSVDVDGLGTLTHDAVPLAAVTFPTFRLPRRRQSLRWRQQMEISDCGAACLAMVLEQLGSRVSLENLREATGTGRGGVSAL